MNSVRESIHNIRVVRKINSTHKRPKNLPGFFFRADDVTGFLQQAKANAEEHRALAAEFKRNLPDGYGQKLAVGSALSNAAALETRYGKDPFARSHGEVFLHLLQSRMHGRAIYLLDEPESPLSISNQIMLLKFLIDVAKKGAQLIIATHAPILMAFPRATLLNLNILPPRSMEWEAIENVSLLRSFLNHPESFLSALEND